MRFLLHYLHLLTLSAVAFSLVSDARAADEKTPPSPSRRAEKGCTWQSIHSADGRASLLVQRCEYGFRTVSMSFDGPSVLQSFSDSPPGTKADKLIEIFEAEANETPAGALKRLFIDKLEPYEKQHCVARPADPKTMPETPFRDKAKSAWVIEPDKQYSAKIRKETPEDEIPAEACGAYGAPVDSRAYFEFHAGKDHFAWVVVGQDTPLFDEQSLEF
ncbi:MAG: hypothetical protein U0136_06415 [Bdellovibrionota bacterium]